MAAIRDASQQHRDAVRWPADRMAEAAPSLFWSAPVSPRLDAPTAPAAEAIEAYINEARWIVECPDCHSAQLAAREDLRFMCHECGNVAIEGLWRPVVWPGDVAGIERELGVRREENTNWLPGETVEQLRIENEDPPPPREGR